MSQSTQFDVCGKPVLVAGGSKGLGQEIALQLVARGANVTVLARSIKALDATKLLMEEKKVLHDQTVACAQLDLTDHGAVSSYISGLREPPHALICVAGGAAEEVGFFADISPEAMSSCMEKNYFSSAYIAQATLRRWVESHAHITHHPAAAVPVRHLVFTASTAAVITVPGYAAYAPTKAAIRSLTDTLRQEVLLYSSSIDVKVHCSFPGTIYTDSFYREQELKPELCKEIEGTLDNTGGMTAKEIATRTLEGLDKGQFFVTTDFQTRLLLNNMRGPSPSDSSVIDWLLGLATSLVWPFIRSSFDRKAINAGKRVKTQ